MEVAEARERVRRAESHIRDCLDRLMEETGIKVEGVFVETADRVSVSAEPARPSAVVVRVFIETSL